ncbi:MAG: DNA-directed RNA polymerase subunit omega [Clostridia bacterium]|nr:DNA-directed RNA polymerase subunit omega [Clostridia bacterium]
MLRPSYSDLLEIINEETDDITLGSRYTIVIAAAKRARQLVDHAEPMITKIKVNKPVSIAVNELYEGRIKVRQAREAGCDEEMLLMDEEENFEATEK